MSRHGPAPEFLGGVVVALDKSVVADIDGLVS
jgi:hypothetical protein